MNSYCAVIPVYNHPYAIGRTVAQVRKHDIAVVLIDDGSDAQCRAVLEQLASADQAVFLRRLAVNRGKGGAVKSGLYFARELGFSHALQIDADGQHNADDIPRFLQAADTEPDSLIAGRPVYDGSVPRLRYYSRYLTHIWVWINTLSLDIEDSMCGFRVYPLHLTCKLLDSTQTGERMDFDPEILVKWHWLGLHITQLATLVSYPADGISHFRGWSDNWLISKMHARLFVGMLLRLPVILLRRPRGSLAARNTQ